MRLWQCGLTVRFLHTLRDTHLFQRLGFLNLGMTWQHDVIKGQFLLARQMQRAASSRASAALEDRMLEKLKYAGKVFDKLNGNLVPV